MRASTNPWQSYQQVATKTAPPGQLVLMLYQGAAKFLERALTGFEMDDPAEANETINNNIIRAQEIIFELNVTLNMNEGGELAKALRSLYEYMDRRLMEANLKKEAEPLRDVLERVVVLRDAWAQMLNSQGANASADGPRAILAAA